MNLRKNIIESSTIRQLREEKAKAEAEIEKIKSHLVQKRIAAQQHLQRFERLGKDKAGLQAKVEGIKAKRLEPLKQKLETLNPKLSGQKNKSKTLHDRLSKSKIQKNSNAQIFENQRRNINSTK